MCFVQSVIIFAADATISGVKLNLSNSELTVSNSAQTVTATIDLSLNGGDTIAARGANYQLTLPKNWTLESYTMPEDAPIQSATTTAGMWGLMSGSTNINSLATLVIGIPADTAVGTYTISVSSVKVNDASNATIFENGTASAELVIKSGETPSTPGYTVSVSANSTSVEKDSTFDVKLNVTSSDQAYFNDFYAELSYDKDLVEYAGKKTDTGYEAVDGYSITKEVSDTDSAEKLIIKKVGNDNIPVSTNPDLTLQFKAIAVGDEAKFTLSYAKMDIADNANQDAQIANGGEVTVNITEPTVYYTVTFDANDHGTAPASQTVENGNMALDPGELTAEGWSFGGWYKEKECTTSWNFETDTVTEDVTLYAKWTKNEPEVFAEEITIGENPYLDGYTLIKATISNAEGNVPTYNGEAMYQVTNVSGSSSYDSVSYYYVVKSTEYYLNKVGYDKTTEDIKITKDGNANQTEVIDINDAQFIYNLYNGVTVTYTPTAKQLLASDVNGDGSVNMQDCAAAIAAIPVRW
jgi:uncharacterized repeat protein (TIGR02543 family)